MTTQATNSRKRKLDDASAYYADGSLPRPDFNQALDLYSLAQKCLAEELQNKVLDSIMGSFRTVPPMASELRALVEHASDDAVLEAWLMQWFADCVTRCGGWQKLKSARDEYYVDFALWDPVYMAFVLDSLTKFPLGEHDGESFLDTDCCTWHRHVVTKECEQ